MINIVNGIVSNEKKIKDCGFTKSTANELRARKIEEVSQLIFFLETGMNNLPKISKKCLEEVKYFLEYNNLKVSEKHLGDVLDREINDCDFSYRIQNSLAYEEIKYIRELILFSEKEVRDFLNLGWKSLREIKKFLEDNQLELASDTITTLRRQTCVGMRLHLVIDDEASRKVVELWIELNKSLLHPLDEDMLKAKYFLENLDLYESGKNDFDPPFNKKAVEKAKQRRERNN